MTYNPTESSFNICWSTTTSNNTTPTPNFSIDSLPSTIYYTGNAIPTIYYTGGSTIGMTGDTGNTGPTGLSVSNEDIDEVLCDPEFGCDIDEVIADYIYTNLREYITKYQRLLDELININNPNAEVVIASNLPAYCVASYINGLLIKMQNQCASYDLDTEYGRQLFSTRVAALSVAYGALNGQYQYYNVIPTSSWIDINAFMASARPIIIGAIRSVIEAEAIDIDQEGLKTALRHYVINNVATLSARFKVLKKYC